jgi:hypothetical protein
VGLDAVEILWAAEDTFNISISDARAAECLTVGDLNQCIARLVAERATVMSGRTISPEPELTWPMLVEILERISGVQRSKVRPDAKWREDLAIN